jgi:hypothetical protein
MVNRISYPQFSLDPITEAIGIIQNGQVMAQKQLLACDLWNVQGAIQGLIFGNPDGHTVGAAHGEVDAKYRELAGLLESAQAQIDDHLADAADPLTATTSSFDPNKLAQIIALVLAMIQDWLASRPVVKAAV